MFALHFNFLPSCVHVIERICYVIHFGTLDDILVILSAREIKCSSLHSPFHKLSKCLTRLFTRSKK